MENYMVISNKGNTKNANQNSMLRTDRAFLVTIAHTESFYGLKPFAHGIIVRLVKDKACNVQSVGAIRAELPYMKTIGYVANGPKTAYEGTATAKDIYDLFEDEIYVRVQAITESRVIALFTVDAEIWQDWARSMYAEDLYLDPVVCAL